MLVSWARKVLREEEKRSSHFALRLAEKGLQQIQAGRAYKAKREQPLMWAHEAFVD